MIRHTVGPKRDAFLCFGLLLFHSGITNDEL